MEVQGAFERLFLPKMLYVILLISSYKYQALDCLLWGQMHFSVSFFFFFFEWVLLKCLYESFLAVELRSRKLNWICLYYRCIFVCLFVIRVRHPRFPLNGIKKCLTCRSCTRECQLYIYIYCSKVTVQCQCQLLLDDRKTLENWERRQVLKFHLQKCSLSCIQSRRPIGFLTKYCSTSTTSTSLVYGTPWNAPWPPNTWESRAWRFRFADCVVPGWRLEWWTEIVLHNFVVVLLLYCLYNILFVQNIVCTIYCCIVCTSITMLLFFCFFWGGGMGNY